MAIARVTSDLTYPDHFYPAATYVGFGSSSTFVTFKFANDVALLLYALYQQVFIHIHLCHHPHSYFGEFNSVATEIVSEGYVLTVLTQNDEAIAKLTPEQLSEAGGPENIIYYHLIPEYQTEESMYNSVRRF